MEFGPSHVLFIILLFWGFVFYFSTKWRKQKRQKLALQKELKDAEQKAQEAKAVQEELARKQAKASEEQSILDFIDYLKHSLQNEYDKDFNGKMDYLESDFFREILKSHQAKIQGLGKDYMKNFVKLGRVLSDRAKTIENLFSFILQLDVDQLRNAALGEVDDDLVREVIAFVQANPTEISTSVFQRRFKIGYSKASQLMGHLEELGVVSQFDGSVRRTLMSDVCNFRYDKIIYRTWSDWVKLLQSELDVFSKMQYNAVHMINALLADDMISFYEVYELFDKLQVWQSNYENLSLNQLQSINSNITELRGSIEEFTSEMRSSLSEVTEHLEAQNCKLENIEGGLVVSNLLTAVNAYQLHQIGKRLNPQGSS